MHFLHTTFNSKLPHEILYTHIYYTISFDGMVSWFDKDSSQCVTHRSGWVYCPIWRVSSQSNFFFSMHVHIMHKWHNVEVNPIPFSDVATTKPRRDQLKLPVMIHSFHFSRHRWRHAVNNLSPAIRAKWFESWTFKKNMSWIFSDAAITYTTHLFGIVHVSTHFLWLRKKCNTTITLCVCGELFQVNLSQIWYAMGVWYTSFKLLDTFEMEAIFPFTVIHISKILFETSLWDTWYFFQL